MPPTGTAVRSNVRSAGANPARVERSAPSKPPGRTTRKGGYPGSPTSDQVREGLLSAGPDVGGRGSRSGSRSRAGNANRSKPGPSTSMGTVFEGPRTTALIAEFLIALLFITISTFTGKDAYAQKMSRMLWQLTSLFLLFFVLALLDKGGKMSKAVVAFGALIDIGIIFVSAKNVLPGITGQGGSTGSSTTSSINVFTSAFSNQGPAQVGTAVFDATDAAFPAPTHEIPTIDEGTASGATTASPANTTAPATTAKPAAKPAPKGSGTSNPLASGIGADSKVK